ncbi:sigma-70 family RNA polymerase sigma factor [Methylobacterium sp. J-067]|uniref:sigma-70 family RNA polymerase sigma factor n=1 Tax=Methylobacterium sp. J-067 TaxID=2836648 RepID=UPI001FBB55C3|nr:sigma-70 family RNA polymerase sigma factor [Methylobacterium sp. J-067]MCJ2023975.1 sigma-70 family RNA polymerase sigma factor [Methylobacterium sp. J-067]
MSAEPELSATSLNVEATLPLPTLSPQIQTHLGRLLAGIYVLPNAEDEATTRFADLLSRLALVFGKLRDPGETEYRQLLLSVAPALRRFALSLARDPTTADDLVQTTLLRAWKNRASFAAGTNFEAWTFTILRNQFYSERRKHKEVQDEEGMHAARLVSLPQQTGRLELQDFQKALAQLNPAMREALILVTVENLSYDEAAVLMGCQVGTVKSRVWRGRDQLARLLGYTVNEVGNDSVMLSTFVGSSVAKT